MNKQSKLNNRKGHPFSHSIEKLSRTVKVLFQKTKSLKKNEKPVTPISEDEVKDFQI